jgi:hypothetical protein
MFLDKYERGKLAINKSRISVLNENEINDYFPALLIPYIEKDEFVMSPLHYYKLRDYMENIENLFIIGWKGNEVLFNKELISKTYRLKRVIIVDPCPEEVKKHLNELLSKKNFEIIHFEDFEDFVLDGIDEDLFN